MRVRRMVTVLAGAMMCVGVARAEQISNPQYENWKKFGEGSTSTVTTSIDAMGQKITTETTNKLVSKSDESVNVEISGSMDMAGTKHPIPTQSQKVPAKVDKGDAPAQVGEGTEKIEAAGKTFDCKVYEIKKDLPDGKTVTAKTWMSSEVPGGIVKMETKSAQGNVSAILKSFEAK